MNFSAVILAGGKSSRMGRDKAVLEIGGQTLLAKQVGLVRGLGAAEIFISVRDGADYSAFGCRVLHDKFPDAGPLAGIERALDAAKSPLLLVLAVDLPEMSEDFLRRLVVGAAESLGAIPRLAGRLEPLAAFYPKTALPLLVKLLEGSLTLSPALSLGERENHSPSPDKSTTKSGTKIMGEPTRLQRLSPLPGGEGQGEGEHTTKKSASAKRFAELCVQSGLACFVELTATETRYFANWNSPADLAPAAT